MKRIAFMVGVIVLAFGASILAQRRIGSAANAMSDEGGLEEALVQVTPPEPAAELSKLAIYIGQWKYEGEYSPEFAGAATKVTGDATGEMILGGHFLQWRWMERGPAGETHGLEIIGYDPVNKNYPSRVYGDDGSMITGAYTIDKNVSRFSAKMIAGGKEQLLTVTETFAADGMSFRQKAVVSADGRSWAPAFEATFTKLGPAPTKMP